MYDYYNTGDNSNSLNNTVSHQALTYAAYKEAYLMVGNLLLSLTKIFKK